MRKRIRPLLPRRISLPLAPPLWPCAGHGRPPGRALLGLAPRTLPGRAGPWPRRSARLNRARDGPAFMEGVARSPAGRPARRTCAAAPARPPAAAAGGRREGTFGRAAAGGTCGAFCRPAALCSALRRGTTTSGRPAAACGSALPRSQSARRCPWSPSPPPPHSIGRRRMRASGPRRRPRRAAAPAAPVRDLSRRGRAGPEPLPPRRTGTCRPRRARIPPSSGPCRRARQGRRGRRHGRRGRPGLRR